MRASIGFAAILLLVLFVVLRPWDDSGSSVEGEVVRRPDPPAGTLPGPPPGVGGTSLIATPRIDLDRSPLADDLNLATKTIQEDLAIVQELFSHYRSVFRENPTGSNDEITRALCGNNKRLFAPLPRDHPALNSKGELVDRWGTPFFFHTLSAQVIEIRSAGADQKHWTDDDHSLSNAPPEPVP